MKYMWNLFYVGGILTTLFYDTFQSSLGIFDRTVDISLINGTVLDPSAYRKQFVIPKNETWLLTIVDFPQELYLGIVQAHSYAYNVTLSYTSNLTRSMFVTGTNIGLNIYNDTNIYLVNSGPYVNISLMIEVTVYPKTAPIPGACNMESETKQAPYLKLTAQNSINKVEAGPARLLNLTCGVPKINYDMYHFFLPTQDFSEETYFQSLHNMMTPKQIIEQGTKSAQRPGPILRRLYNSFVGNGAVYVIIATVENTTYQSAYIPVLTYSCSVIHADNSCDVLQSGLSKVLCAFIFFLGLLLCTVGHSCFRLQMFLTGAVLSGLLAYIIGTALNLTYNGVMWSTVLGCLIGGTIWWKIWNICGRPMFAVMASGFMLGYITAGIITAYLPDESAYMQSDTLYYTTFVCTTVTTAIIVSLLLCWGSVPSCALLGSFAMTFPLDYYLGGHFKYIVINSIRRATITDFKYAVSTPPFQSVDIWLTVLRVTVAVCSAYFQWRRARGHAPFPSNHYPRSGRGNRRGGSYRPRRYWTDDSPPARPLLGASRGMSYGSDEVFESPQPILNYQRY